MNGYEAMMAALQVSGLSPAEKLTLITLASHANENGECWPGIDRLKTLTGLGRSSVLRSLATLERAGLVAITRQTGTPNRYRLNLNQYHSDTSTSTTVTPASAPTSTTVEPLPVPQWNGGSTTVEPEQTNNKPIEQTKEEAAAAPDAAFVAVIRAYEGNIALITPAVSDAIGSALDDYGEKWVLDAIRIASEGNKRNWRYIAGILRSWGRKGHQDLEPKETARTNGHSLSKDEARQERNLSALEAVARRYNDGS